MKKIYIITIFSIIALGSVLFFIFYYSFFLKPITKEEAGINEYASLLSIENNTESNIYIILNFSFSNNEIQELKKYKYLETNNYFLKDTIELGGIKSYSNHLDFELSGILEKPQLLPQEFNLKILDSTKHILKSWDKVNFEKDFKFEKNKREITITKQSNNIIIR
ncbi:hypothetical protein [Flavobacterium oreochromis]|uniref:Uncharacterized protein n=2 Tax=Flavobacterium TaxID=237 RepID=A0A246G7F1_9FLAO|nr:hypothetical protein [Flavobacterium oreochromis]OWP74401.1 hypothetical protein BWK62_14405 [Flavobacterium oreochromis]OWP74779.1 hypothetical protein BWG23_13065 [Flavobacterium oreochromis]POR23171.1 hypothetical protein BWK58_10275 [Flavobacterium columnare]QYS87052.1 hypothetical protein JJC03_03520 [Flavobacterium oreochromis]